MINGHSLNGSASRTMLTALKHAVRNGVLVMQALDDPDYKYRRPLTSTWRISAPDDPNTAYAYTELRLRFVPSPRDITRAEIVDSWLVWLHSVEDKRATHRVFHWARGAPQWLLAQREGCSERTIVNRIDRSMAAILREFLCTETDMEVVDEPAAAPVHSFHGEHTSDVTGAIERHGKVFIDGVGFMKDGRRLRDGREKVDKFLRKEAPAGPGLARGSHLHGPISDLKPARVKAKRGRSRPRAHGRSGPGKTATDVSFLRVAGLA
jgi:Domain of unknown function (DUF6362)